MEKYPYMLADLNHGSSENLLSPRDERDSRRKYSSRAFSNNYMTLFLCAVMFISCIANLIFAVKLFGPFGDLNSSFHGSSPYLSRNDISPYAKIPRDTPLPYKEGDESIFNHSNLTIANAAWENWSVDPGIVSLPYDYVEGKSLPRAQQWPWDTTKGIYLINGYHQIHCLYMIRKTLVDAMEGKIDLAEASPYDASIHHSLHCIEALRQDAVCNADDTPLYTGYSKQKLAGVGQNRMCRSWDKLEAWARSNTACYRDIGRGSQGFHHIERFKFCPEGYVFSATGNTTAPWDTGNGDETPPVIKHGHAEKSI